MIVVRARALGMCFGVRDALAAMRAIDEPGEYSVHGQLVHNARVQRELRARGFAQREVDGAAPVEHARRGVVVTAHGISDQERASLRARGHELVDTTCPLVRRAHDAARGLADEGFHVVVLGRKGHVEVRGLVGDLAEYTIVERADDVASWASPKLGVVCQTTLPEPQRDVLVERIRALNPEAELVLRDTICEPTKERQRAVLELVREVDCVVVVGGANSNNTAKLVSSCEAAGCPAYHVCDADELPWAELAGARRVGLTAGTSTPDELVDAVEAALRAGA